MNEQETRQKAIRNPELFLAAHILAGQSPESQVAFCVAILNQLGKDNKDVPELKAAGFTYLEDGPHRHVENAVNFLNAVRPRKGENHVVVEISV